MAAILAIGIVPQSGPSFVTIQLKVPYMGGGWEDRRVIYDICWRNKSSKDYRLLCHNQQKTKALK